MKNIVAIVQARMGSSRLPGKVLMISSGKSLLEHLIERLKITKFVNKVIIATSVDKKDDPIINICDKTNTNYFRGSERDVLSRFTEAAINYEAEIIVRITADCPLIDHEIVDYAIKLFLDYFPKYELVTNRFPLTFPDGLDVDVMDINSLKNANKYAKKDLYREHIVPYFWSENKSYFNFKDKDYGFKKFRWTIDYKEDFDVIDKIISNLYPKYANNYLTKDIITFLKSNKDISEINSNYIE